MRTTVELPPELMRQAKARAAARGESLKTLFTRAVASELGKSRNLKGTGTRVQLPLFGNPNKKPIDVTAADVARALAEEDLVRLQRAKSPRGK